MGQLIAEYTNAASSGGGGTSYLTADHLGSTRVVTDAGGNVKARHDYLPFGEEIPATIGGRSGIAGYGANDTTKQRYTGKERDGESGLDYFGARYYSSPQGRFTSTDPVIIKANRLFDPQRLNLYAYVRGNPLAFYDPDGKDLRSGTGDQKRIKKALVEAAKRQGGRDFLQKLDKLTIQIELNTGDLSGRAGREYGTTAPKDPNKHEFTRQRDAGGNIVDIKGDPVVVTVDFNRADKDRETNKAAKELGVPQREGVPASDAQLLGHELGHDEAQFFQLTNTEESVTGRIDTILQEPVDKNLAKDAEKFVDNLLKPNEQKPPEEKKKPN